jgi:hypothetical protein
MHVSSGSAAAQLFVQPDAAVSLAAPSNSGAVRPVNSSVRCAVNLRKELKLFTFHGAPVFAHWTVLLAFPFGWAIEKSILGALVAQAAFFVLMLA